MFMQIIFIILFFAANELTYNIASHQQMGLNRHALMGELCWLNRILLLVLGIWYCGWIASIILFILSLFTFPHLFLGWILSVPQLFMQDPRNMYTVSNIESSLIYVVDLITLVFMILSFIFAPFGSVLDLLKPYWLIILIILIAGFIIRAVVAKIVTSRT